MHSLIFLQSILCIFHKLLNFFSYFILFFSFSIFVLIFQCLTFFRSSGAIICYEYAMRRKVFLLKVYIFCLTGGFLGLFMYLFIVLYSTLFICSHSNFAVSENAEIEPWTVATLTLAARRSNLSARSHPFFICLNATNPPALFHRVNI
jgi:hypothetical protein